jgi:thioredoxin 1
MEINDQNFQKDVLENKNLVMVDFWAPWCMPCQMLKPMVEELGEEMKEKVDVKTMNVDENQETAKKYGIQSIPAVFFFKNGEVVKEVIGMQSKDSYIEIIDELSR